MITVNFKFVHTVWDIHGRPCMCKMKVFRFLFTKVSFFSSLVKGGTCTRVCGFLKTF